jgi:hypothetical protein
MQIMRRDIKDRKYFYERVESMDQVESACLESTRPSVQIPVLPKEKIATKFETRKTPGRTKTFVLSKDINKEMYPCLLLILNSVIIYVLQSLKMTIKLK